jgi:acetyl esterase/lipase
MFEWIIRFARRAWDETASWPLPMQRADIAARPYAHSYVKRVAVRPTTLGGVPVRCFIPANPGVTRIVFFHGGSYIYGSTETSHADLCAHLALATSLEVVGVEYRLAPEHPWPAQLEDAIGVCRALPGPLILAGDSAGGHLCVKTALQVVVKALVLVSPWVDLEMANWGSAANDPFETGTRDGLVRHALAVAGSLPASSLALANDPLGALPPTLVSVGELEILRDDMLAFVEKLRAAGAQCTLHVAKDMPHDPVLFVGFHPSADATFDAAACFIRQYAG